MATVVLSPHELAAHLKPLLIAAYSSSFDISHDTGSETGAYKLQEASSVARSEHETLLDIVELDSYFRIPGYLSVYEV